MGKGIVKYRYIILAVFIALIVVSVIFLPTMIERVNYDLTSYLPDDYETSKGYAFLSETFNIHGDVEIGVTATRGEISKAAEEILKLDGVTNAIWAQYMETLLELGVYSADDGEFLDMYNIFTDALGQGSGAKGRRRQRRPGRKRQLRLRGRKGVQLGSAGDSPLPALFAGSDTRVRRDRKRAQRHRRRRQLRDERHE